MVTQEGQLAPGPDGPPLIGNLLEARQDPLAFTVKLSREYGDIARFHLGPFRGLLINHPAGVHHVLQDYHQNYDKQNYDYAMLKPFLGEGLITSDGQRWLRDRRALQPAFHHNRIAGHLDLMANCVDGFVDDWSAGSNPLATMDVAHEMNMLALRMVCQTLFGMRLGPNEKNLLTAFSRLNREVGARFMSLTPLPLWVPTPANLRARGALRTIDDIVSQLTRRAKEAPKGSGLDLIMQSADKDRGRSDPQKYMRDQLVTLILAGHETTGSLLSWTWYLLAQHPAVAQKVTQEASEVLSHGPPTVDQIDGLKYTELVVRETLRLYPPVWIISRRAIAEDQILGYRIPAGSVVVVCSYALHRNPNYWDEPSVFAPERFARSLNSDWVPEAYFPFGGGPRKCIGGELAMLEAKLAIAMISSRYRLLYEDDQPVRPRALVTLRPQGGLPMRAIPLS